MDDDLETQIAEAMGDDEPDTPAEPDAEPDVEPDAEPEPEPAPEPEPDGAEQVIAKLDKYADRARKYLAKNMSEVLEEAANDYVECPFCNYYNTPGFLHASPCPPELLGTVYEWTNTTAPDEYLPDSASRVCDMCNGLGEVRTGSKVRGQEVLPCIDCTGKGWIAVGPERSGGLMSIPNGATIAAVPPADTSEHAILASQNLTPEAEAARAQGFTVIPPFSLTG